MSHICTIYVRSVWAQTECGEYLCQFGFRFLQWFRGQHADNTSMTVSLTPSDCHSWCRLDRACFYVIFFGLWVHALSSSLSFCYQYQCNWLPGKIRPRNDLLCVEWDVKLCSTQLMMSWGLTTSAVVVPLHVCRGITGSYATFKLDFIRRIHTHVVHSIQLLLLLLLLLLVSSS